MKKLLVLIAGILFMVSATSFAAGPAPAPLTNATTACCHCTCGTQCSPGACQSHCGCSCDN